MGYYNVLYNELYYYIKDIYGLELENKEAIIQGSVDSFFYFGAIFGAI